MKHKNVALVAALLVGAASVALADNAIPLALPASTAAQLSAPTAPNESGAPVQQDAQAQQIIRAADRIRAPNESFRYTVKLNEFQSGKSVMQQTLDISMRFYKPEERAKKGDARALVRFVEPVKDKGKAMLSDYEKMWYYAPDLRRPIPISKQQRLIGQISNGDVVAADFDYSYVSQLQGEEPCGKTVCYRLSLQRRWPFVTYPKIMYWVEKNTFYPWRADFMSDSGVVIKRSYYSDYRTELGQMRPHRIIVEDSLRKENYTTMDYSDVRFESLPESYFQVDYLMRMN
ncbi:outer membrane lipoprotein-sorting protein [Paraburkholderia sacchari]|uniref:outer membrane lipoprotein-sorting protein n=1 Tax=Paraburkholderia sacchari TaxID=159450 RepID=UPI0005440EC9|nr:outer membrane lipoprotein-sorting protein [Paraburkholderia sacchari]NLP65231.1 outer membrane lipoprotein-sorting protein [Paraburkholderia sacchari]